MMGTTNEMLGAMIAPKLILGSIAFLFKNYFKIKISYSYTLAESGR
jgi:hypothetical protein